MAKNSSRLKMTQEKFANERNQCDTHTRISLPPRNKPHFAKLESLINIRYSIINVGFGFHDQLAVACCPSVFVSLSFSPNGKISIVQKR